MQLAYLKGDGDVVQAALPRFRMFKQRCDGVGDKEE
jgi:hypothetical protein